MVSNRIILVEKATTPERSELSKAVRFVLRNGSAAAALSMSVTSIAVSQTAFDATLELSGLNSSTGFVINGVDQSDSSGSAVSGAGDINGDGIDDVIIGASRADPSGNNSGESYVVFGGLSVGEVELSNLDGSNGFVIEGNAPGDYSGVSVSDAGDVNGDGIADLIIGARRADSNGSFASGSSYVVFGGANVGSGNGVVKLFDLIGSNGFVVNGADSFDNSGIDVSGAGDINGDGIDDLIIGANLAETNSPNNRGESYVLFGSGNVGNGGEINVTDIDGSDGFVIFGIDAGDFSGFSVSDAGDINGDGVDDLVVGAYFADPGGKSSAGESYVVFGSGGIGNSGSLELSNLNGTNGFVINGRVAQFRSGSSVSGAGDVNGDGVDDLIIGAPLGQPNGLFQAGEIYVVFGGGVVGSGGTVETQSLNGSDGFVINGIDGADRAGETVSGAGDVNGDGLDDLLIGAYGGGSAGESFVVFGATGVGGTGKIELSELNGNNGFLISGIDSNDSSGSSVSGAGDFNGDGVSDIIIGAPFADPGGRFSAGESYVVFGRGVGEQCNGLAVTVDFNLGQQTTPGDDVVLGTNGPDIIRGKGGNDTICGMGGADFIHGNSGNDWIDGGNGVDNLRGGQGDDVIYTGNGATAGTASRAFGGTGNDEINGGSDADDLRGGRGVDTIRGFGGNDVISGNQDDDALIGGSGNDILKGGSGDDTLNGGGGSSDVCDGGSGVGDLALASCEVVSTVP